MPCWTNATWASNVFWTGRGQELAEGSTTVALAGGSGTASARRTRFVSTGLVTVTVGLGFAFDWGVLPVCHQSQAKNIASARARNQYRKLLLPFCETGNLYLR